MDFNGSLIVPVTRALIYRILKKKSIVEFLEKKGHFPVKQLTGGRISYFCPLPWHSESKPSFVVWTNSDYENFYCFGCLAKHNIIHLVSFLDGISTRQSIELLAEGLEFSLKDEENFVIEEILQKADPDHQQEFSKVLLEISGICNSYLQSVDYDINECERIDKLWTIVDNSLRDYDFEKIETIRAEIGGLILRQKDAMSRKYVEEMQKRHGNKDDL